MNAKKENASTDKSVQLHKQPVAISMPKAPAQMAVSQAASEETAGVIPKTLEIPAIHVKASVDKVGLLPSGKVGVPKGSKTVAWYKDGTKPGDQGNAVIDGHVDDTVNPAVFYDLNKLKPGDKLYILDSKGKKLTFVVKRLAVYPRNNAPIDQIFGYTYSRMLNLITCEGKYNPVTTERSNRLVVYTELQ
jgi:LPXTG-site transpeptidase (sortase) family protein